MSEGDRDDVQQWLQSAKALLEWDAELGWSGVPLAREGNAPPTRPADATARERGAQSPERQPTSPTLTSAAVAATGAASTMNDARPPARQERERAQEPAAPRVVLSGDERRLRLATLQEQAASCTKCELHAGRTKSVFARGNPDSAIVFVGEGPGYNEDQQGLPFVGQAGQLLDKMIAAMGYAPQDVYICNVVKCRPPENRTPLPPEMGACEPFLVGQLDAIAPKVIVALGKCAAQALGCVPENGRGWRGAWKTWRGIPTMATYHPAYLLRSPQEKRVVWEDLQKVMAHLAAG